jgi:hypothetical protein
MKSVKSYYRVMLGPEESHFGLVIRAATRDSSRLVGYTEVIPEPFGASSQSRNTLGGSPETLFPAS